MIQEREDECKFFVGRKGEIGGFGVEERRWDGKMVGYVVYLYPQPKFLSEKFFSSKMNIDDNFPLESDRHREWGGVYIWGSTGEEGEEGENDGRWVVDLSGWWVLVREVGLGYLGRGKEKIWGWVEREGGLSGGMDEDVR